MMKDECNSSRDVCRVIQVKVFTSLLELNIHVQKLVDTLNLLFILKKEKANMLLGNWVGRENNTVSNKGKATRTLRIRYNKSSVCSLPRLADTSMARCACTQMKRVKDSVLLSIDRRSIF